MKEKIMITGADGMLGSQLFKKLESEYNIIGITKNKSDLKIKCDITNKTEVSTIIKKIKPNIIVHLAGITGNIECEKNPRKTIHTNVMGTYFILEAIKNTKIKIIFASSREVYGNVTNKVDEHAMLQPINLNGITKMFSENLIKEYCEKYNIDFTILRFTNFYGEENEKRGISKMMKDGLSDKKITIFGGKQSVDLIHIDDAIKAIINTIKLRKNGIFNIGYGKSITILTLIKLLDKYSNNHIKYKIKKPRNVETQKFSMNISKATKELKFEAKITPKMGIKRMILKWQRK